MDAVLVVIMISTLSLSIGLAIVGWRLLHGNRQDVAVRAEALRALAAMPDAPGFEGAGDDRVMPIFASPGPDPTSEIEISTRHATATRDPLTDWDATLGRAVQVPADPSDRSIFGATARPEASAWRRRLVAALSLAVLASAGTVYAVHRPTQPERRSEPSAALVPAGVVPLDLLSLSESVDGDGTFTVVGLVGNPASGHPVRGVVAVVYLFDREGHYFAAGRAAIDAASFVPGAQSPFVVKVAHGSDAARYRVGFRDPDGAVVPHVDKRGESVAGTTEGDTTSRGQGH